MVFHKILNDSKSSQLSRTLISIPGDFNIAVVCLVLILPLIPFSTSLCSNPLVACQLLFVSPSPPCSTDFFSPLARSKYLFIFSLSFIFTLWSAGTGQSNWWKIIFFLLINTNSSLLAGIGWPVYISNSQRIIGASFSRTCGLSVFQMLISSNFDLLQNFQDRVLTSVIRCEKAESDKKNKKISV